MNQTKRWMRGMSVFLLIVAWAVFSPGIINAGVSVDPVDLGEAPAGTTTTWILDISTSSPLGMGWVFDWYKNSYGFVKSEEPDRNDKTTPTSIKISWNPSEALIGNECTATLRIWDGGYFLLDTVTLKAIVVPAGGPEPPTITGLLEFFDSAVGNGGLQGKGPGKSASHRLNAFRNMLVEAGSLLDQGMTEEACGQLIAAKKKLGVFVIGSESALSGGGSLAELEDMLNQVLESLSDG